MSDKSTILKAFNSHFFEFLDDVITILPDNLDIQTARTAFETIKRANPTTLIKAWYLHIYSPYTSIIDAGDIRFFTEKDYNSDLSHLPNAKEVMGIIEALREPVRNMSATNQESTMKYVLNLSKLSVMYPR